MLNNLEDLESLIQILKEHKVSKFSYKNEGLEFKIGMNEGTKVITQNVVERPIDAQVIPAAEAPMPAGPSSGPDPKSSNTISITAPLVGTFYQSPGPGAKEFVELGDTIKKGQVLCIIEAMKIMNEIESEVEGKITSIKAENSSPVEYGQVLFEIEPI